MRKSLLLTIIAVWLTGCGTIKTQAIGGQSLAAMQNEVVLTTQHEVPTFQTITPASMAFGPLGALASLAYGNDIVSANQVPDPALSISSAMLVSLGAKHGVQAPAAPLVVKTEDAAEIAAAAQNSARFVLDVRSIGWSIMYFPTNWTHYWLNYGVHARLIDVQRKAVVAEAACRLKQPEDSSMSLSYDGWVGNQAAGLKRKLTATSRDCAIELERAMFPGAAMGPVNNRTTAVGNSPAAPVTTVTTVTPVAPVAPVASFAPPAPPVPAAAAAVTSIPSPASSEVPTPPSSNRPSPLDELGENPAYSRALAEVFQSHPALDPNSRWYREETAQWVAERKSEFLKKGVTPQAALKRAIDALDRE